MVGFIVISSYMYTVHFDDTHPPLFLPNLSFPDIPTNLSFLAFEFPFSFLVCFCCFVFVVGSGDPMNFIMVAYKSTGG